VRSRAGRETKNAAAIFRQKYPAVSGQGDADFRQDDVCRRLDFEEKRRVGGSVLLDRSL
jgi:hypothetical protein